MGNRGNDTDREIVCRQEEEEINAESFPDRAFPKWLGLGLSRGRSRVCCCHAGRFLWRGSVFSVYFVALTFQSCQLFTCCWGLWHRHTHADTLFLLYKDTPTHEHTWLHIRTGTLYFYHTFTQYSNGGREHEVFTCSSLKQYRPSNVPLPTARLTLTVPLV